MFRELRPRLPLLGIALAALAGIMVAERWALVALWVVSSALLTGGAALVWQRTPLVLACCALVFASLHTVRHAQHPARELERALENGPRVARVNGRVCSDPEPLPFFSRTQTGTLRIRIDRIEIEGHALDLKAQLLTTWCGPLPHFGDRVSMSGSLQRLDGPRNPGQFDFRNYLRREGIFARLEANYRDDCQVLDPSAGFSAMAAAIRARHWMQAQLARDLDDSPEIAALIASMVLGLRGDTPEEVQDLFRRTGTLHLFAVSGLNIAMLAIIAAYVLRPLGRRAVPLLTIPILIFYALVTGLSASCVRATIMGVLVLLAIVLERPGAVYNSLAAAAVLILAWDTNQLFAPGFQFSFVLVFAIVWLSDRIAKRVEPLARPDPFLPQPLWSWWQHAIAWGGRMVAASVGVTVAAWLGSLIFTAGYFHLFSPSALLANTLAVPLAFLVLALGLAATLTSLVSTSVAVLFNNANWVCAKGLLGTVELFAALPGGYRYVEFPRPGAPPACEVTVLDLADGAGIHLRSGRENWMIDGGARWRYTNLTLPYLRSRGVNRLDALIVSHGDVAHIGSALALLDDFRPQSIYDSPLKDRSSTRRSFHKAIGDAKRGKRFLQRGDELACGPATLRVLFPPAGYARSVADDKALVLRLECEGVRVLFMSDSGMATERWLMENETDLHADVVVKGHHTKDLSGTLDFLRKVQPRAIAVGQLPYGHTSAELDRWVESIAPLSCVIFRQDECGAVALKIRDGALEARGWMNGQALRSRAQ